MNSYRLTFLCLFLLTITTTIHAEEEPAKDWSNEMDLSYVETKGNTELMTFSVKNLLKYNLTEKLNTAWKLNILYGEHQGEKNSESYFTEFKINYLFTDRLFALYIFGGERNTFAGIRYKINTGPGIGYKWLIGPKHFLLSEVGGEYIRENNTEKVTNQYIRGRAYAEYDYEFSKKNKFIQCVAYLQSFEDRKDYNIDSITAVTSAINDILSLKSSYEIRYDHMPAVASNEALETTDRIFTVALVINF